MITASELERTIRALLDQKRSPLAAHTPGIVRAGLRWGVHPYLLVAIAWAETRAATDPNAGKDITERHNAWGYGPHRAFPTWEAALEAIGRDLRRNYLNRGLLTIPRIRDRWAPLGAANDPHGLNPGWALNVRTVIGWLGGDPDSPVGPARVPWQTKTWLPRRYPWLPKRRPR